MTWGSNTCKVPKIFEQNLFPCFRDDNAMGDAFDCDSETGTGRAHGVTSSGPTDQEGNGQREGTTTITVQQ
ncbi:hypothetical protein ZHAS_00012018 [Anopheles sinensis]|uniref:Uncharacterized protein n=1 Tax=Anopheles sinensis TaxID=74873 RepID=A0A084W1T0_ANOSI|nr:hypothetical protein ZHAS_00012018 [Anopheles sinensis]